MIEFTEEDREALRGAVEILERFKSGADGSSYPTAGEGTALASRAHELAGTLADIANRREGSREGRVMSGSKFPEDAEPKGDEAIAECVRRGWFAVPGPGTAERAHTWERFIPPAGMVADLNRLAHFRDTGDAT